jgi:hypothetical protein
LIPIVAVKTYAIFIVNLADPTQGFGSTHNSNGLDGNTVTEAGALAIDDTWDVDVCADAVLFTSFDDSVVGANGLQNERLVSSCRG